MTTKNTGGCAFPTDLLDNYGHVSGYSHGMTLRDYFAAKAMQATVQAWISRSIYPSTDFEVAENAYKIADAMLEARNV